MKVVPRCRGGYSQIEEEVEAHTSTFLLRKVWAKLARFEMIKRMFRPYEDE